jgi:hypothetical protein
MERERAMCHKHIKTCPAPLMGGGVLSAVWGEYAARLRETILI